MLMLRTAVPRNILTGVRSPSCRHTPLLTTARTLHAAAAVRSGNSAARTSRKLLFPVRRPAPSLAAAPLPAGLRALSAVGLAVLGATWLCGWSSSLPTREDQDPHRLPSAPRSSVLAASPNVLNAGADDHNHGHDNDDADDDDDDDTDTEILANLLIEAMSHEDLIVVMFAVVPISVLAFSIPFILQRTAYRSRVLTHRLNVSLNSVVKGPDGKNRLLLRTLHETDVRNLMRNKVGVNQLIRAATTSVTRSSPFVRLPPEQQWTWYNQILNEVSSLTALGHLSADAGLPAKRVTYVMALTREPDATVLSKKIRVLLVRKDVLAKLPTMETPLFAVDLHSIRWETLLKMSKLHFKGVGKGEGNSRSRDEGKEDSDDESSEVLKYPSHGDPVVASSLEAGPKDNTWNAVHGGKVSDHGGTSGFFSMFGLGAHSGRLPVRFMEIELCFPAPVQSVERRPTQPAPRSPQQEPEPVEDAKEGELSSAEPLGTSKWEATGGKFPKE